MSKDKRDEGEQADPERRDDGAGDAERAEAEAEQRVEQDIHDAMTVVQRERDELEQRLMRTAADYQNYIRRAEQNASSAREQQLMDIARGLVTVLDHFDRAVEADPEQTSTRDLLDGVNMVRSELLRVLAQFGIQRMEVSPGEPFDPNHHEALMRQASDEWDSSAVTAQFRPGYKLGEKTIRPAQVSVAE
ncbi:MAG: nucleotide exchange factor GrpE [Phycisphaeraceae bacterium]